LEDAFAIPLSSGAVFLDVGLISLPDLEAINQKD
jgi:hypothetical protein